LILAVFWCRIVGGSGFCDMVLNLRIQGNYSTKVLDRQTCDFGERARQVQVAPILRLSRYAILLKRDEALYMC